MEQNIDIYEILKSVPAGEELYSPMCGKVSFSSLDENKESVEAIWTMNDNGEYSFDKFGRWIKCGEVMLFPSKESRDWEKFAESLKPAFELGSLYVFTEEDEDGEITIIGELIGKNESRDTLTFGNQLELEVENFVTDQAFDLRISAHKELRPATAEECEHFKNAKGRWANSKKKHKLNTFDKVLVRKGESDDWLPAIYCRKNGGTHRVLVTTLGFVGNFKNCIEYKGHEHLAFTDNPETDLPF